MRTTITRYHDISCGHRVVGHEGKCKFLHGHNYRFHFKAGADDNLLDKVGRVVDFSVIKSTLCQWLEDTWDHKFLAWDGDEFLHAMTNAALICAVADKLRKEGGDKSLATHDHRKTVQALEDSIVWVPFNPTAENIAAHVLNVVGPALLTDYGVTLLSVVVEETRKCSAEVTL